MLILPLQPPNHYSLCTPPPQPAVLPTGLTPNDGRAPRDDFSLLSARDTPVNPTGAVSRALEVATTQATLGDIDEMFVWLKKAEQWSEDGQPEVARRIVAITVSGYQRAYAQAMGRAAVQADISGVPGVQPHLVDASLYAKIANSIEPGSITIDKDQVNQVLLSANKRSYELSLSLAAHQAYHFSNASGAISFVERAREYAKAANDFVPGSVVIDEDEIREILILGYQKNYEKNLETAESMSNSGDAAGAKRYYRETARVCAEEANKLRAGSIVVDATRVSKFLDSATE